MLLEGETYVLKSVGVSSIDILYSTSTVYTVNGGQCCLSAACSSMSAKWHP
jgi:hypothetical protein